MKIWLAGFLGMIVAARAETPAEAHAALAKTYETSGGWELVYDLSKNGEKKAEAWVNVAKDRKFAAVEFSILNSPIKTGVGYYPPTDVAQPVLEIRHGDKKTQLTGAEDFGAFLHAISPEPKIESFFALKAILTPDTFNIAGAISSTIDKTFPWGEEIIKNIEDVRKADGKMIFTGKDGELITFEEKTGLLLEHQMLKPEKRKMTLRVRKELQIFEGEIHGLKAPIDNVFKEGHDAAKKFYQLQHSIAILNTSSRLKKLEKAQQKEAIVRLEKALLKHYQRVDLHHRYLSDPKGLTPLIKRGVIGLIDNFEKTVEKKGANPTEELIIERDRIPELYSKTLAKKLAKRMAATPLYGIRLEKFPEEDHESITAILAAHRKMMFYTLYERHFIYEIAQRVGKR